MEATSGSSILALVTALAAGTGMSDAAWSDADGPKTPSEKFALVDHLERNDISVTRVVGISSQDGARVS